MGEVRVELLIYGRVQGVWFRGSTVDMARPLGLKGTVRNLPDGSVEAVFEGPREKVEEAVEWCRSGPSGARVSRLHSTWGQATGAFHDFRVVY